MPSLKMPSASATTTTAMKETAAVEERESLSPNADRNPPNSRLEVTLNMAVFEQILEMDEDDEQNFSKSIVFGFLDQAEETFEQMKKSLSKEGLPNLSSLGHFLKGSSATLGLTKLEENCKKIQHLGSKLDETGNRTIHDDDLCLSKISAALDEMEVEYKNAKKYFEKFFEDLPES